MSRSRLTLLLGLAFPLAIWGQASAEYRVKAAFIYNLAKFVEWPQESFTSPVAPLSICILGKNPFGDSLAEVVRGKTIQNRALVVRAASDPLDVAACHVLFVSSSERKKFAAILSAPIAGLLTVGDTDSFLASGGVVNFRVEDDRIRLQINPDAAERHRLRISSRLLSLAEICKEGR